MAIELRMQYGGSISSIFSSKSEASASELLECHDEMVMLGVSGTNNTCNNCQTQENEHLHFEI